MKTLVVLTTLSLLSSASATSIRSARAAHVANLDPAEDSLLDVSNADKAAIQHRELLVELQARERVAAQAKQALEAEQKSLVAVQQVQQLLEARLTKMEASEGMLEPGVPSHVAAERGTVKSDASQNSKADSMGEKEVLKPSSVLSQLTQALNIEMAMMASGVPSASIIPGIIQATSINVTQTEKQFWEDKNQGFFQTVSGIAFYLLTMLIAAVIYLQVIEKSVGPKLPEYMVRVDEFQYGAFECGECDRDWQICFCSWCCEWVRWADTASHPQVDFIAFWPALFITALLSATSSITFGLTIPILLLIVVLCRQRIRLAYGLPSGTCSVLAWDCCLWLWCPCCAIVQEARQVEYVESGLIKQEMIPPSFGP